MKKNSSNFEWLHGNPQRSAAYHRMATLPPFPPKGGGRPHHIPFQKSPQSWSPEPPTPSLWEWVGGITSPLGPRHASGGESSPLRSPDGPSDTTRKCRAPAGVSSLPPNYVLARSFQQPAGQPSPPLLPLRRRRSQPREAGGQCLLRGLARAWVGTGVDSEVGADHRHVSKPE